MTNIQRCRQRGVFYQSIGKPTIKICSNGIYFYFFKCKHITTYLEAGSQRDLSTRSLTRVHRTFLAGWKKGCSWCWSANSFSQTVFWPWSMILPRESIWWKKYLFTSLGRQKNDILWKSLGAIMVNRVPRPKTLRAAGLRPELSLATKIWEISQI